MRTNSFLIETIFTLTFISLIKDSNSANSTDSSPSNEFIINDYIQDEQSFPALAMNDEGDFVVVWMSRGQDGADFGVYGKKFDDSGTSIGDEFIVNATTIEEQSSPALAINNEGNFVVVWTEIGTGEYGDDIYGLRFDSEGREQCEPFIINDNRIGRQRSASVDQHENGYFAVAWHSDSADGSSWNIFGKTFPPEYCQDSGDDDIDDDLDDDINDDFDDDTGSTDDDINDDFDDDSTAQDDEEATSSDTSDRGACGC